MLGRVALALLESSGTLAIEALCEFDHRAPAADAMGHPDIGRVGAALWLAEAGKFVGAKVVGAIITVAVVAGGFWCYRNWDQVEAFGRVIKLVLAWLVVVAALPWISILFMKQLLDYQASLTNAKLAHFASVAIIAGFWIVDILVALWLADWSISGGFTWFVVILGFAAAGAYNYVICESLARHVDS